MPRTKELKDAAETPDEVLVPFSVILDGESRTVFAKDHDDLQARVAKMRGQ